MSYIILEGVIPKESELGTFVKCCKRNGHGLKRRNYTMKWTDWNKKVRQYKWGVLNSWQAQPILERYSVQGWDALFKIPFLKKTIFCKINFN